MSKRKHAPEELGGKYFELYMADLIDFPSTSGSRIKNPLPLTKKCPFIGRNIESIVAIQEEKSRRKVDERCDALPSPSTNGSIRAYPSQDHSAPVNSCQLDRPSLTQLSTNIIEQTTDGTRLENDLGKASSALLGLSAVDEQDQEIELGHAVIEPLRKSSKSEPAATSAISDSKEPLKSSSDNGLSEKQKLHPQEPSPTANIPNIGISEKPTEELGVGEAQQKVTQNPIGYWAVHHIWPPKFTVHDWMASSNANKRPRPSDPSQSGMDGRSSSYHRDREAAEEKLLLTRGLVMNTFKGEDLLSEESKKLCFDLQQITQKIVEPSIFPNEAIRKVIMYCKSRNKAMVNRDVTPIIIPSIASLYFGGDDSLEHVIDEVNAD